MGEEEEEFVMGKVRRFVEEKNKRRKKRKRKRKK